MSKDNIINYFWIRLFICITKKENISEIYIHAINKLNSFMNLLYKSYFPLSCHLHFLTEKNSKDIKFSKLKINLKSQNYISDFFS